MLSIKTIRYQIQYKEMTKKMYITKPNTYNLAILLLRLEELQNKGARMVKQGKPYLSGTNLTFEVMQKAEEVDAAIKELCEDARKYDLELEKEVS